MEIKKEITKIIFIIILSLSLFLLWNIVEAKAQEYYFPLLNVTSATHTSGNTFNIQASQFSTCSGSNLTRVRYWDNASSTWITGNNTTAANCAIATFGFNAVLGNGDGIYGIGWVTPNTGALFENMAYYAYFQRTGTTLTQIIPEIDPFLNSSTYIQITSPTSTTASRTFNVSFNYRLDSNYPNASDFSHVLLTLCPQMYVNDPCLKFSTTTTAFDSIQSKTISVTANRDGYHLLLANFWNGIDESTECPWWNPFCTEEVAIVGPGDSINFNVATTTIDADVPAWILNGNFCGNFTGIIDSAMCNGLAFLFIPNAESINRIFSLDDILAQKQPFGFFFLVKQKMDEVSSSEATAGTGLTVNMGTDSIGTITVFNFTSAKSEFTAMGMDGSQIQQIMIWILWLMLGWYVWYRTMTMGNSAPPKQLDLT